MLNFLRGTILRKKNNVVCVAVGDTGHEVVLSPTHAAGVSKGQSLEFFTHLVVREDAQELFGFRSFEELDFFRLLIGVSGVGPKTGSNLLSLGTIDEIKSAIGRADAGFLTRIAGIGKKTAERIIVDLKEKVGIIDAPEVGAQGGLFNDVADALSAMGYKKSEITDIVKKSVSDGGSAEDILRRSLKMLAH